MKTFKRFFSHSNSSKKTKRRRTRNKKLSRNKYKLRGGWGGTLMKDVPQMFKKEGFMKGGWGGPVITTNPV